MIIWSRHWGVPYYAWIKRYDQGQSKATRDKDLTVELARLKKELQRVKEERDILNEEG